MKRICVNTSHKYEVIIGKDLLKDAGTHIAQVVNVCKAFVVTDELVASHYLSALSNSLVSAGFEPFTFVFAGGEEEKNMNTISDILESMAENDFTRSDIIIALGGGVVGDVAGFAASAFLRGISFIQIPTTFLAAVDSSVGGKTGVNLKSGKNLSGAFWQPSLVLCDCNTFATLPYKVFCDGVAEAIKYGVILDSQLFNLMVAHGKALYETLPSDEIIEITARCVSIKRDIVIQDERDTGLRQLLNFGHTLGHSIEKCSNYNISHGHAVAIGMVMVAKASDSLGLSEDACYRSIESLLCEFDIPVTCPFTAKELISVALKDKKRTGDSITLVIPTHIGKCRLEKININQLEHFIEAALRSIPNK